MVFSLSFMPFLPPMGYADDPVGPAKRAKLQQYFAEALASTGQAGGQGGVATKAPGGFRGTLGSPLMEGPLPDDDAIGFMQLLPSQQQQQQQHQQGLYLRRPGSSGSSGTWGQQPKPAGRAAAEATSPAAIASPRAASESTAASQSACSAATTPDSAIDLLAQAAAAAAGPIPPAVAAAAGTAAAAGAASPVLSGASAAQQEPPSPSVSSGGSSFSAAAAAAMEQAIDLRFVIERLKAQRITGQVCAWGWEQAAALSLRRRSMPAELFTALWSATDASAGSCYPQDALSLLESWLTLGTHHRHFRLHAHILHTLLAYSFPPAVKRATEQQLGQMASLCAEVALLRSGEDVVRRGPSARDLMQPLFALVAAEVAWRCCNEMRYVSVHTLAAVDRASAAWRWKVVRHRDRPALRALKEATAEALALLQGHMPE